MEIPISVPYFYLMRESVRIIRFTVVGTLNAVIVAFMVGVLMHLIGVGYLLANVVAYIVAQTNNFLWCKYWIFPLSKETKKNSIRRQILFFLIAFVMAYSSQFLFLLVLVEVFHFNEYLAQFLGLFVSGAVNFMSNRLITFR